MLILHFLGKQRISIGDINSLFGCWENRGKEETTNILELIFLSYSCSYIFQASKKGVFLSRQ